MAQLLENWALSSFWRSSPRKHW